MGSVTVKCSVSFLNSIEKLECCIDERSSAAKNIGKKTDQDLEEAIIQQKLFLFQKTMPH